MLACIFLPYTPGDYDVLSVTLSTMAQLSTFAALLLVPIGVPWLIYEIAKGKTKDKKHSGKIIYRFAVASLTVSSIVAIAASLGAFVNGSRYLAILILTIYAFILLRLAANLWRIKASDDNQFNATPLYLIFIPVVVVFVRFTFITRASDFSRNYTIRQSEKFIQDIEAYKSRTGRYPSSLLSLWNDYRPSTIGVKQFHYEPYGNAYNLYFEHFSTAIGVREIVMFNSLDEHEMTSHDSDLLRPSQEDLNRQRGYISIHQLPQSHWKSFWFD